MFSSCTATADVSGNFWKLLRTYSLVGFGEMGFARSHGLQGHALYG